MALRFQIQDSSLLTHLERGILEDLLLWLEYWKNSRHMSHCLAEPGCNRGGAVWKLTPPHSFDQQGALQS